MSERLYWLLKDILELLHPDCPYPEDQRRTMIEMAQHDLDEIKNTEVTE